VKLHVGMQLHKYMEHCIDVKFIEEWTLTCSNLHAVYQKLESSLFSSASHVPISDTSYWLHWVSSLKLIVHINLTVH